MNKAMIKGIVDRVWKSFVEGAVLYIGAHSAEINLADFDAWLKMLLYGAAMAGLSAIINGVIEPMLKGAALMEEPPAEGIIDHEDGDEENNQ